MLLITKKLIYIYCTWYMKDIERWNVLNRPSGDGRPEDVWNGRLNIMFGGAGWTGHHYFISHTRIRCNVRCVWNSQNIDKKKRQKYKWCMFGVCVCVCCVCVRGKHTHSDKQYCYRVNHNVICLFFDITTNFWHDFSEVHSHIFLLALNSIDDNL